MSLNCECKLFLAEDFSLATSNFQSALEQLKSHLSERGANCNYSLTIKDNCEEAVKINPVDFQSIIIDSELFKSPTNREKEFCGLRIVNNIADRVRNRQVKIIYWTTEADLDLLRENVLFVKKELALESLERMIRWLCRQKLQNNELPGEWGTGKRVGQPERMRAFSLLKHRIAHLWLPLDIDIQGINKCWNDGKKNVAQEYLKEVLKDKNGNSAYYRQKLAKLQYIVAGKHVDFSKANSTIECEDSKIKGCSSVEPADKSNLLIDNKSIYDLILESDKENKIISSENWQALEFLSGLEIVNRDDKKSEADKENPQLKIYRPIDYKNSPISQFICLMDSRIKEKRYNNVEEILNFFIALDNGKGWELKKANPESIKSFHEWFCALDNCLKNLRMKL